MPAPGFQLACNDCHVWTLSLEQPSDVLARLQQNLSEDEIRRAKRYRFARQRQQFTLVRGALRQLLGCYLDMASENCRFTLSESNKPALAEAKIDLRFNVAHAGGQAIIAIARGIEIGVDIEARQPLDERQALADMILSPAEKERWQALYEEARTLAFYALWTRKEAVTKAIGLGLLMDFNTLEVSFERDLPARLLGLPAQYGRPQDWTLTELDAPSGHTAALAAPVLGLRVLQRIWHPQGVPHDI